MQGVTLKTQHVVRRPAQSRQSDKWTGWDIPRRRDADPSNPGLLFLLVDIIQHDRQSGWLAGLLRKKNSNGIESR